MSRSLSATFLAEILARRSSEVCHTLLTLTGTGITTKRYVDNRENVTSGGNVYTAAYFTSHLPADVEDEIPDVNLVFGNVDLALMSDIRTVTDVPEVEINFVLKSDPNTVEMGPFDYNVRSVDYDRRLVRGNLQYEDLLNETWPNRAYTPQLYPGLFP